MIISEEIYKQALTSFGTDNQINQAIEECNELALVLNHWRRGKRFDIEVLREIADVEIMISQMKHILYMEVEDALKFAEIKQEKLYTLKIKIEQNEREKDES